MTDKVKVGIQFNAEAGNVKKVVDQVKKDIDLTRLKPSLQKVDLIPTWDTARYNRIIHEAQKTISVEVLPVVKLSELKLPPISFDTANSLNLTNQLSRSLTEGLTRDIESVASVNLQKIRKDLDATLMAPTLSGQTQGYDKILSDLAKWEAANRSTLTSSKELQSVYSSLTQSAGEGLDAVNQRASSLAGMAGNVAAGLAGVGTFLAGVAVGSLVVASNFEQLEAKLVSVTGSLGEARAKFEFAQDLAAKSPFDLRSMVSATAILEGYKQKSEELLPVAGNLAAALGTDLASATQTVGKAASGSLEGFESLRNTYAIANTELKKFGGQVDAQNQILSRTPEQIEKNRAALIKLINFRYGDAMVRQSQTLQGSLSNVGEAAQVLTANFGKGLIPAATLVSNILGSTIGVLGKIPAPLLAIGAASVVAVAGIAGIGAATAGVVAGSLLLQVSLANLVRQLRVLKIEAPLASGALQTLSAGMTRVSGSLNAANLASVGFRLGFVGAASAVAIAGLAMADSMEKSAQIAGDSVTESTRKFAQGNKFLRDSIGVLNKAGKETGVVVKLVGDAGTQFEQINNAFLRLSSIQIVRGFQEAGKGVATLKDELAGAEKGAIELKRKLDILIDARARLTSEGEAAADFKLQQGESRGLAAQGFDVKSLTDLDQAIQGLTFEYGKLGVAKNVALRGLEAFEKVEGPLVKATEASKQLQSFLDLSTQAGTAQALAGALAEVESQLAKNAAVAQIGSSNVDELLNKLRNPDLAKPERAEERAGIEAQIALAQKRVAILGAQANAEKAVRDKADEEIERAFRRRKALGQTSLHDELYFLNQRLEATKQGTQEEISLLEQRASLLGQIQSKLREQAQKRLTNELEEIRKIIKDGQEKAPVASSSPYPLAGQSEAPVASNSTQVFDDAKVRTEAWAKANADLLKQFPELQSELNKFQASQALDRQRAHAQDLKNNLQQILGPLQTALSEATNGEEKLGLVSGAILNLQRARRAGLLDEAATQDELNKFTRQKLQLEKSILQERQAQALQALSDQTGIEQTEALNSKERLAAIEAGIDRVKAAILAKTVDQTKAEQALNQLANQRSQIEKQISQEKTNQNATLANLELQNLQGEQQILEAQQGAGAKVEAEITANKAAQMQLRIDMIEAEKEATIRATGDIAFAEQQAALKTTALRNQESLARLQILKKEQAEASNANRIGGSRSPIYSDPNESAFGSGKLFDFSFQGLPKVKLPSRSLAMNRSTVPPSFPGASTSPESGSRAPRGDSPGSITTNNFTMTFNGITDEALAKKVLTVVKEAVNTAQFKGKI